MFVVSLSHAAIFNQFEPWPQLWKLIDVNIVVFKCLSRIKRAKSLWPTTITVIIFKLCLGVWLLSDADWRIFNIEFVGSVYSPWLSSFNFHECRKISRFSSQSDIRNLEKKKTTTTTKLSSNHARLVCSQIVIILIAIRNYITIHRAGPSIDRLTKGNVWGAWYRFTYEFYNTRHVYFKQYFAGHEL